ncbi:hypothetical protein VE00_07541 [Pseudogymnoascus sp. WSF 3629]|nr:hypothetical protein VE00_07541 [Pseudogymnoascus sp. WSF 3629]
MSLPSYKDAITPLDPLDFVAAYLSTHDLLTCCLVNKNFHHVFAKYLWEDPLRIIGNGAKRIPFHLEKYRLLSKSIAATRESTKNLVKIIDYRQQWIPKMYALPKHVSQRALTMDAGYWNSQRIVYKLLSDLPAHFLRAKFLFLDDIEFPLSSSPPQETCHPLLLSLRNCQNISTILTPDDDAAEFLSEVIYLDISHTALRDAYGHLTYPPQQLMLPSLRILKLQHVSLQDSDLRALLAASPHQLQLASLDVRDNKLTDGVIPDLEQHLVWRLDPSSPPPHPPHPPNSAMEQQSIYLESPPAYSERPRAEDEQQETFIRDSPHLPPDDPETFTARAREHADMSDLMPYSGLTALYLSGNGFTSDAFLRLVRASDRVQVLDLDVPFKETRYSASLPSPRAADEEQEEGPAHPVEIAAHHLSLALSPRLSTLRAHHALVTHPSSTYTADTNPHLTSLTLTSIPPLSPAPLLSSLKTFLLAAATQERAIALTRSDRGEGGRRGVKVRPGLRHLRLELGAQVESVSGDRDADAFVAAGQGDFSFFDNPETEEGGGGKKDGKGEGGKEERVNVRAELRRWRGAEGGGENRWGGRLEVVVRGGEGE